jgi:hypothetical protein
VNIIDLLLVVAPAHPASGAVDATRGTIFVRKPQAPRTDSTAPSPLDGDSLSLDTHTATASDSAVEPEPDSTDTLEPDSTDTPELDSTDTLELDSVNEPEVDGSDAPEDTATPELDSASPDADSADDVLDTSEPGPAVVVPECQSAADCPGSLSACTPP